MPPSSSFVSFASVACKLALVVTTIGYAGILAHRMREQNAQLRKAVDEGKDEREKLLKELAVERRRAKAVAQEKQAEVEFWWHMEGLSRAQLVRKEAILQEAETEAVAQRNQIRDLQTQLSSPSPPKSEQGSWIAVADDADAPRAELPDVRSSLATFDDVVLHMVRTLNLEISEVASQVTNAFRVAEPPDPDMFTHAFERAREAVGPVMAELLETIQHQDDPILIDIALKADMVGFAAEITSAWDFQHQSKSVFSGVYKQMQRSGTSSFLHPPRRLL